MAMVQQMQERLAIIGGKVHFENRDGFYTHIETPKIEVGMIKVLIADDQAFDSWVSQIILSAHTDIEVGRAVGDGECWKSFIGYAQTGI